MCFITFPVFGVHDLPIYQKFKKKLVETALHRGEFIKWDSGLQGPEGFWHA